MKKKFLVLTLILAGMFGSLTADEGMWLPMFVKRLNHVDMQKAGLKLSAEEIYSVNNSSIKDAIVGLSSSPTPNGYFCTGEIVSPEGLMFTNHHCAYDLIQKHSSVENDYLQHGFWAMSKSEELPNEGLTASFLIRMLDVTDSVLSVVKPEMTFDERNAAIRKKNSELRKANSENGKLHVVVKSFFEGNEYYLFVYEVYRDVRLVGAPPSAVGKFGGDTDNWMWPRHTGDFAVLRVYTAPDGSPADYSPENIPLKPKHHLPISLDGIQKNDFAMIWGFPGSTDRYLTSFGVQFNVEKQFPALIELYGKKLEVWKQFMDVDQKAKIQYASKYASTANTWKYLIGQTRGLKRLNVTAKKQHIENQFTNWIKADEKRTAQYADVLPNLQNGYKQLGETISPLLYTTIAGSGGAEIVGFAMGFNALKELLKPINKKDIPKDKEQEKKLIADRKAQLEKTIESLRKQSTEHFKNYHAPADQMLLAEMLSLYQKNVPEALMAVHVNSINKKYKGNFQSYASEAFSKSVFTSEAKVAELLNKPSLKAIQNDPILLLADGFSAKTMELAGAFQTAQKSVAMSKRFLMAGLRQMQPEKVFYPDANSTMRMTFGAVQDYQAADAVNYDFVTTMNGILEKEDPQNDEFIVPAKLKDLIEKRDFGAYGVDGKLIVCFLSSTDITGGNSGSPVINGKGELIGIAFDGNWEAMSGDIAYETQLQRTINVDIRYVLFIIDKYAGATHLIDELTIRKSEPLPVRTEGSVL